MNSLLYYILILYSAVPIITNKYSIKKQNIEYLCKRNNFFFQIVAIDFSVPFLACSLSCWIWSSILKSIKILLLSFILKTYRNFFQHSFLLCFINIKFYVYRCGWTYLKSYNFYITVFLKLCVTIFQCYHD